MFLNLKDRVKLHCLRFKKGKDCVYVQRTLKCNSITIKRNGYFFFFKTGLNKLP